MPNPAPLEAVAEAAEQRRQASHEYLAALVQARQAGHSLQAIAEQAGVTKQAVRQIVERGEKR
jgi:predicted transcriptional regulator